MSVQKHWLLGGWYTTNKPCQYRKHWLLGGWYTINKPLKITGKKYKKKRKKIEKKREIFFEKSAGNPHPKKGGEIGCACVYPGFNITNIFVLLRKKRGNALPVKRHH